MFKPDFFFGKRGKLQRTFARTDPFIDQRGENRRHFLTPNRWGPDINHNAGIVLVNILISTVRILVPAH
jgi:hypothetical protein